MTKKVVRGLLDIVGLEDDEWELKKPSENFMYGMGLGASPEATRWAYKGYILELLLASEPSQRENVNLLLQTRKKMRGGQLKKSRQTNDAKRAFVLYATVERIREVKNLSRESKIEFPLNELIELTEQLFPTYELFKKPTYKNKMLASVKRGREIWGIDKYWRGPSLQSLLNQ